MRNSVYRDFFHKLKSIPHNPYALSRKEKRYATKWLDKHEPKLTKKSGKWDAIFKMEE